MTNSQYLQIDQAFCYSIPLRMRFRGIEVREGMIFNCQGHWREWSPFLEYGDAEAATWLRAALAINDDMQRLRDAVPVNVTVPVVEPELAYQLVKESGCQTAKVKVADPRSDLADDLARLRAVREALGADGYLRIDANGAWTVDQAYQALQLFAPLGLQYAEQPCMATVDLAKLRHGLVSAGIQVPIAADESVRKASDPDLVASLQAADFMVLKVQPLGGVANCLAIQQRLGLPAVLSSALETSVGIWAGVQAAAKLPGLSMASGLGTVRLLAGDVVAESLLSEAGAIQAVHEPEVSEAKLAQWAAAPERALHWQQRLARCLAILQEDK